MLDVQAVGRFVFKLIGDEAGNRMAEEHEGRGDGTAEDRLEAALDRIAKVLETPDPVATEVAERLDRIISSVRDALAKS